MIIKVVNLIILFVLINIVYVNWVVHKSRHYLYIRWRGRDFLTGGWFHNQLFQKPCWQRQQKSKKRKPHVVSNASFSHHCTPPSLKKLASKLWSSLKSVRCPPGPEKSRRLMIAHVVLWHIGIIQRKTKIMSHEVMLVLTKVSWTMKAPWNRRQHRFSKSYSSAIDHMSTGKILPKMVMKYPNSICYLF